jgi:hypothetical protein
MRREAKGRVVPMDAEVKVGTLSGVLRPAEIWPEEFTSALRG